MSIYATRQNAPTIENPKPISGSGVQAVFVPEPFRSAFDVGCHFRLNLGQILGMDQIKPALDRIRDVLGVIAEHLVPAAVVLDDLPLWGEGHVPSRV